MEELDAEGPIATNRRPAFSARIDMTPNSSWTVREFRSCCEGSAGLGDWSGEEARSGEVVVGKRW